ncbi:MAG: hypothetical protein IJU52_03295, partial [Clostridia bacterium]|nr:hypothetical protein [Clostridia bacterium]
GAAFLEKRPRVVLCISKKRPRVAFSGRSPRVERRIPKTAPGDQNVKAGKRQTITLREALYKKPEIWYNTRKSSPGR